MPLPRFSRCSQCSKAFEYWYHWDSWIRLGPRPNYLTIQMWTGHSALFLDPECIFDGRTAVWLHVCKHRMHQAADLLQNALTLGEAAETLESQSARIIKDLLRDQLVVKALKLATNVPEDRVLDDTAARALDKRRRV